MKGFQDGRVLWDELTVVSDPAAQSLFPTEHDRTSFLRFDTTLLQSTMANQVSITTTEHIN